MATALEWILTNSYKADMISYLETHPEEFEALVELAVEDKQPYSWRAAWLLWSCIEKNDKRLQGHIKRIIDVLPSRGDEQQRELMITLQKMEIKEEYEGLLFDHCVTVWEQINKKSSVRYNAFKILVKIAQNHPDLSNEVMSLAQDRYTDSLSSNTKRAISRMLDHLN